MFAYSLFLDGISSLEPGRGSANTFDGKAITARAADAKRLCSRYDFHCAAFAAHGRFFACAENPFIKISVRPNNDTKQLADMWIRIKIFMLSEKLPITAVATLPSAPINSRITK